MLDNLKSIIEKYIKHIQNIGIKKAKEVSYRTPLENLLNGFISLAKDKATKILHEGRIKEIIETTSNKTPDFLVYKEQLNITSLGGLVEAKDEHINLLEVIQTAQIKEYAKFTTNILVTNYKQFILLGKVNHKLIILKKVNLLDDNIKSLYTEKVAQEFKDLLSSFLLKESEYIVAKKDLANILAIHTNNLQGAILNYCSLHEDAFCNKFHALHDEYNKIVSIVQSFEEFLESYSQSFIYGLVISKITYEQKHKKPFMLKEDGVDFIDDASNEFSSYYKALY